MPFLLPIRDQFGLKTRLISRLKFKDVRALVLGWFSRRQLLLETLQAMGDPVF